MKFSVFGEKFSSQSGIVELMEDLGTALNENPEIIFMGGGNPGHLLDVETVYQQRLEQLLNNPVERHSLFGIYQSPQGDKEFRIQTADLLRREFGWAVTEKNIAVSNGSQSAFFVLYNMFAGLMPDGSSRVIHLPLAPEYLGYSDIGLKEPFFSATRPAIEMLDDHLFKYRVDFSQLNIDQSTAALCVSRPTNPTGNVLTDDEIEHLDHIATTNHIPLIIDGAYGLPFPNIIFNQAKPHWNENTILVLSLSKLGLPGARTGIIVGSEDIIRAYTSANTIVNLACSNMGPSIARKLFASGEILTLCKNKIMPFYKERAQQTVSWFRRALGDIPYRIHKPEGAFFLWIWFKDLPITSQQLYLRLKNKGVLIVPGESFFPGIHDQWSHKHECIRVSYVQDMDSIKQGIDIIADEVEKIYSE